MSTSEFILEHTDLDQVIRWLESALITARERMLERAQRLEDTKRMISGYRVRIPYAPRT